MSETLQRLKELMITRLKLKITPDQLGEETQLFGPDGLGLDSIDALEIGLMIQQHYGVELRSEDEQARDAFQSLRKLTQFVLAKRK